jgi:hypothetical protein
MYIKIKDNHIEKYPYSIDQLKQENPNTSFPANITDLTLNAFDVHKVHTTPQPQIDYTKNLTEGTPILEDDEWVQVWSVTDASEEEIARRNANTIENITHQRIEAYRNESDPLFFKAQRNEATMEEWLAKVAEIKLRYSY